MAFTPILKPLNANGTTFYTFSSAARDLSKCMANTQKEFVFSHFVCINIPDFINTSNYDHNNPSQNNNHSSYCPGTGGSSAQLDKNFTQLGGIHDLLYRDYNDRTVKSTSQELAETLQDYVFNYEELLLSQSDDNDTDRSVAERTFWHWMKEMGAINWTFDQAKIAPYLQNHNQARFVEGNSDLPNYENVVKYIGNIDITNNVDIANEAYTEIYVHIPSEAGNTPVVLFQQEFDGNFSANHQAQVLNDQAWILGQHGIDQSCPIDLRALYDSEPSDTVKDYENGGIVSYGTQPSTANEYISYGNGYEVNTYKTDLDGVCIDFDTNSYADIVLNNIPNMDEFNKTGNSFEFNAVLVYYDIVDVSSQTRTSNLYGILFLDDVKSDFWDYFQRYPKYKPVAGVQNGNSYGFKLNLRIDIEPDKTGITTLVNEYNTFSMSLFGDAIARMQDCTDTFIRVRNSLLSLESRVSDLETVMSAINNYEVLAQRLEELSNSLENANLAFADRNSLLDLIAHVSDNVDSIMSGRANVQLQYNTDVIRGGYNTTIDTSTPNRVIVNSTTSGYNLCKCYFNGIEITSSNPLVLNNTQQNNDVYTSLRQMTNMARIHVSNAYPADYDIKVYIDSSLVNWRLGQNFKIVFPEMTLDSLNGKDIKIYTGENYSSEHVIYNTELIGDKPIIELTCIDDTLSLNNSFVHDILR